jgi:hypothetical protein
VLVAMSASNSSKHANDHQLIRVLSSDDKPSRYLNTIHIAFPKRPPECTADDISDCVVVLLICKRSYWGMIYEFVDRRSAFGGKADNICSL